ncbi:hypothetical protein SAMN05660976_06815 [Nonomuraea pusilla]|uniref:Uncharacterized protein n=1 Tax=Nonomuraea pusilla TaxID=46177 RepID=A0A1H8DWZ4_9ACTN|nr:hypothetical protein SAMN05660976_06815 [Nonomuraea pusilla]
MRSLPVIRMLAEAVSEPLGMPGSVIGRVVFSWGRMMISLNREREAR